MLKAALACVILTVTGFVNAGLIVNGDGKLTGATDIFIAGELYDVSFVDGTCVSLFDGCDRTSDFLWRDIDSSYLASQALIEQVFLDSSEGLFDSSPELTRGCEDSLLCNVYTPWNSRNNGTDVLVRIATNWEEGLRVDGSRAGDSRNKSDNTLAQSTKTWAVWSISIKKVPEPSTFAIFALGIIGLASRRFKKQS